MVDSKEYAELVKKAVRHIERRRMVGPDVHALFSTNKLLRMKGLDKEKRQSLMETGVKCCNSILLKP